MPSITNEFKVGLLVIVAVVLIVGSYLWSFDGVRPGQGSYTLLAPVPSAMGLYEGTPVRLAGVEIGAVEDIEVVGDHAMLTLRLDDDYRMPEGTEVEIKSSGLLGDAYVAIYPGSGDRILVEGAVVDTRPPPGDLDAITRNLERVSDDIAAITGILREVVEDRRNIEAVEATLANVEGLTEELRLMVQLNRGDVDAIVDSVRRLTEALEGYAADIASDVDEELDKVKVLTDELTASAENVTSITGKIDRGQGTLGALVNDDETIRNLNETVEEVREGIRSLTAIQPEFYYIGRYYAGTQPKDLEKFPTGNELAWSGSNTIGLRLRAHEDFWYFFELVDHPQGNVQQREIYREETGDFEVRWIRTRGFRFSFMVEKRWNFASFRLGLKEDGGGLGLTFYALKDRLQFSADVFSFTFGSYPAVAEKGVPNLRAFVRYEPWRNVFFEVGAEQIVLGAKNGFFTGYAGIGFTFRDVNLRGVLLSLPSGALQ